MKKLEDYYKHSLFYQSIMHPLDKESMVNKEGTTQGIDTYTVQRGETIEENDVGIIVKGDCSQYFIGRNLNAEENICDRYHYEVSIHLVDAQHLVMEVEADIDRYNGNETFWEHKTLPTANVATIGHENGSYHIAFQERYFLFDTLFIHESSLRDIVEVYETPEDFKMGDSFDTCVRHVFTSLVIHDGIEKIRVLRQQNKNNKVNQK